MTWRTQQEQQSTNLLRLGLAAGLSLVLLAATLALWLMTRRSEDPTLSLNPASGPPGTAVLVVGRNWPAAGPLTVSLSRPGDATGEELGVAESQADGDFTFDFVFPQTGPWSGQSRVDVVARSLDGRVTARAPFAVAPQTPVAQVIQPTGTPPPSPLPAPTRIIGSPQPPVQPLPPPVGPPAGGGPGTLVTVTAAANPTTRVAGIVQAIAVDSGVLTIAPLQGAVNQVLLAPTGAVIGLSGQPISIGLVPLGAVIEAEGEQDGDRFLADRVYVRSVPAAPPTLPPARPNLPPALPTVTQVVAPTSPPTPIVIVVTATPPPVPNTATPQPSPTRTPPRISEWRGEYWTNRSLAGPSAYVRNDEHIDFDWRDGGPRMPDGSDLPGDNFSARWTRSVRFDAGTYRFKARADDGVRVWVDDDLIIDEWRASDAGRVYEREKQVRAGWRDIRVEYYEATGRAAVSVWWEPADFSGWKAEFWSNRSLTGAPEVVRDLGQVYEDWRTSSPDPLIPSNDFSARFTRRLRFDEGLYRFTVTADDGARLWIDGQLVIDRWRDGLGTDSVERRLSGGDHDLRLEYYERSGGALVQLGWALLPPTPTPSLVPTETPVPALPSATPTFTLTLTVTRTPAPPTLTPTASLAPATPTTTATAPAPTASATATLTPTATPTGTATATPTRTRVPLPQPTIVEVLPWQAQDFPLAASGAELVGPLTGSIGQSFDVAPGLDCYAFELQMANNASVWVLPHGEAIRRAAGLDDATPAILSPRCAALPTEPRASVRVWGTRRPDGAIDALLVQEVTPGGQEPPVLYARPFILDAEAERSLPRLRGLTVWIRSTVGAAPGLVQNESALASALAGRPPDEQVLVRGQLGATGTGLALVTAWRLPNGATSYIEVYRER